MSEDSKAKPNSGLAPSPAIPLMFDTEPDGVLNQRAYHLKTQNRSLLAFSLLDLCYVTWLVPSSGRSLLRTAVLREQSEYHYAQGLDLSSAANVAAFLSRYVSARKKENVSAIKPKQCTFCCYDIFSGKDLRVEFAFPGSITTYLLDGFGQRQEIQDIMWRRVRVSSAVRSLACLQTDLDKPEASFRGASVASPLMDCNSAAMIIKDFTELVFKCGPVRYRQHMLWPTSPGLRNSVFQLLYQGLIQHQLTTEAEALCRVLATKLPAAEALAVTAALAQDCAPGRETATARRESAIRRLAQASVATELKDSAVLYHQSRALLHHASKPEAALAVAQASVGVGDDHPWLWFNVASVHASMGNIESALAALNTVTPAQLLAHTVPDTSAVDRSVLIDTFRSVTARLRSQDAAKGNLAKIPFHDDRVLAKLAAAQLPEVLNPAYQVLIELYRSLGWPALQQHRKQLFTAASAPQDDAAKSEPAAAEPSNEERLESGETPRSRQRPLQLWLDNLFHMLLDDIVMLGKLTAALQEPSARTKMDWYRFGLLTSRLHRYEDAHKCFHHCLTECQSRSSLRLKTLVHLLSINTQRSDVDDFVIACDELDGMVAEVPADWRGSVSRHQAVIQALALAAKIGPQRLINAFKSASRSDHGEASIRDAVMSALLRKIVPLT
eukprot:m.162900 g.162900  ORF g.162900 m.162900 type:complete len:668 (+) comp16544_c1_seq4:91-2094(+)